MATGDKHLDGSEPEDALTGALLNEAPGVSSLTLEQLIRPQSMLVASRIMESIPTMAAAVTNDLYYIYANRLYVKTVNSKRDSWAGLTVKEYLPDYLYEQIEARLERATRGERATYYLDVTTPDGTARTILVNYEPIFTSEGKSEFFLMTGIDSSALKAAQFRLVESQKLETIARMTGGIAHDFNNQLGIFVGALSLLEMSTLNPKQLHLVGMCRKAAEQCTNLTTQLLRFGSSRQIQPSSIIVSELLNSIIPLARISLPPDISLELNSENARYAISVDPTQLESAILNLILNARDSISNEGKITISVTLANVENDIWTKTTEANAQFVCIELCDTGCGMKPDVANRAFEPFFTTKPPGHGAGMGLAMVYEFAKQSGGHVELITAPSRGTIMRIYLPRAEYAVHHKRTVTLTRPNAAVRLAVLVVEDERSVADITCALLNSLGHIACCCNNADDALAIIASEKIDVVLTDLQIHGRLSGLQLRELITTRYPDIRVICMSGYVDPASAVNSRIGSEIDFLHKPIKPEMLAAILTSPQSHQAPGLRC